MNDEKVVFYHLIANKMWKEKITKTDLWYAVIREKDNGDAGKETEYRNGQYRDWRKWNLKTYFTLDDTRWALVLARIKWKSS